jgi:hypothetical protein
MSDLPRHGGPYDRGSMDRYYDRGTQPHYYVGPTHGGKRVEEADMTPEEIEEYYRGYNDNERARNFKNWEYN